MKRVVNSETDLNWVYRYLKDGEYPPGLTATEKRMVRKRAERFCFLEDQLIFLGTVQAKEYGAPARKVLLTHAEKLQVVGAAHIDKEGNHNGLERAVDTVSVKYYWVGIYKFVKDYIRSCRSCRATRPRLGSSHSPAQAAASIVEESVDDVSSIGGEYECGSTSSTEAGSLQVDESEPESKHFWDMVDLRLFGPYGVGPVYKYILVVLDAYTMWPEAFVLDNVSQTSIVHVLLKLISRYGQMNALYMSRDNEVLEAGVRDALEILQQAISFKISLQRSYLKVTDNHYAELEETLGVFVKKYPKKWSDCLDLWLLPRRTSLREITDTCTPTQARDSALPAGLSSPRAGTSQMNDIDTAKVVELLMRANDPEARAEVSDIPAVRETVEKDIPPFIPPSPKPVESSPVSTPRIGIMTRSRTGNSKPKDLDTENVYSNRKRKPSTPGDTPVGKHTKTGPTAQEELHSDTESDTSVAGSPTTKLTVELDDYYEAIARYINGDGYKPHSSASFKRLLRDVSKNYAMKDDILYQMGNGSSPLKRVIMKNPERYRLLQVAHESDDFEAGHLHKSSMLAKLRNVHWKGKDGHLHKSSMLAKLRNVHWKGKGVDCQVFVLACSYCDNGERKLKDVPPPLEKKLLTKDTFDTYKEIRNYIKYEVFSSDTVAKKLEDIMKLVKKFRVEDGSLFHVVANRRLSLLTNAADRLEAVKLSHLLKGTHADEKGTQKQLCENYYWFGMITDVRVYISMCCGNSDCHNLIERYFKFRELNMNIPLENVPDRIPYTPIRRIRIKIERPIEDAGVTAAKDSDEMDCYSPMEEPVDDVKENTKVSPSSTDDTQMKLPTDCGQGDSKKPSGIFVATNTESDSEEETPIEESTTVDEPDVDKEDSEDAQRIELLTDVVTEPPKADNKQEHVSAIVPKVVTIKVPQAGDFASNKHAVIVPGAKALAATHRLLSDPVTIAAVKSILPGECIMSTEIDVRVHPGDKKNEGSKSDKTEINSSGVSVSTPVSDKSLDKPVVVGASSSNVPLIEATPENRSLSASVLANVERKRNIMEGIGEASNSDDSELMDTDDDEEDSMYANIEVTPDGVPRLVTNTPLQGAQVLRVRDPLQAVAALTGDDGGPAGSHRPRPHYRCTVCSKLFYGEIKFKIHMYKHTGQKPFKCEQCDKKYTNNKSLALHMKVHSGDLHFLCSVCGKATVSKTALKSHLKSHLSPGGGFPVKCDICHREFRRRHLMERHKQFKHIRLQTEFPCTSCSKVFGHQRSLKRHYMSLHMGVRNHTCEFCDKSFYRKEYLTSHMLQHAGHDVFRKSRTPSYKQPAIVYSGKQEAEDDGGGVEEGDVEDPDKNQQVQRIILHEDEHGGMSVVDMNTAREVKRLLDNSVIRPEIGETMVVQIEQPSGGECRIVRVDNGGMVQVESGNVIQTEEQVVEVPLEGETYMEYQEIDGQQTEYVTILPTSAAHATASTDQYTYGYTHASVETAAQGSQELLYGQPAVQYEVECVGDVDHDEALSAINLLAQASAAQYETVVSHI